MSRVCLIVPGFSTAEGDGCIPALRELALALAERHDVTVVALRYPHSRVPYQLGRAKVLPLGGALTAGPARLGLLARAVATVRAAGPFDVVHGLWADEPGLVAAVAGRLLGARVVVSFMGGELAAVAGVGYGGRLERAGPWLVEAACRGADVITVGSRWLGERVPGRFADKVVAMPLGLTPRGGAPRRAAPPQGSPLRVGQVASLLPVKAPGLLLSAADAAARQGAALEVHLIGGGPLEGRLREQAARTGVPVRFHGQVPFGGLPERYAALDVLVQTSWWESQGMAVLEAGAAGCALAGTGVGVLAELDTAIGLTPPGDAASLGRLLVSLDRGRCRAAGHATAAEVLARYSLAATVARWERLALP